MDEKKPILNAPPISDSREKNVPELDSSEPLPAAIAPTEATEPSGKAVKIEFRVRFSETDQMGVVWHGNYFSWFEMGRVEQLRRRGISYREVEERGYAFTIIHAECDYKKPARYDDLLTLATEITRITPVRIEHRYHLYRGDELLAVGKTILATLDKNGEIKRVPDWLR